MKILSPIKYEYGNLKIGGGGFVTGITFHPTDSRTLYIRTDIGGVYSYDFDKQTWVYLADKVTADDPAQTYPLAIALDENDPNKLFSPAEINAQIMSAYLLIRVKTSHKSLSHAPFTETKLAEPQATDLFIKTAGCISALRPQALSILRIWAKAGKT